MTCRDLYMTPIASMAAVPFHMTANGPEDVDAKFRSAFEAKFEPRLFMASTLICSSAA